jgi:hypothetical protein
MNIDQQLAALHGALDDVLDLERGYADAVLPSAHAELVTGLGAALDVEAGLAQVVPPTSGLPPRVLDGFIAFADEFSALPAAERLAARAWLPVGLLVEAYVLAKHVPTVQGLCVRLGKAKTYARASVRGDARRVLRDLDRSDLRFTELHRIARTLVRRLRLGKGAIDLAHLNSLQLRELFAKRLAALLVEIGRRARGVNLAQHIPKRLVDVAFAEALLGPLSRLVSALTSVVGADLTEANLAGLPLGGVRWSPDTRWPEDWQEWVRDNSIAVAPEVFEIRAGAAGSWLPT